jgi:hypothetical protein
VSCNAWEMATIGNVEKRISKVEEFDIQFLHPDGRDVRGDKRDIPGYDYERKLKGSATVSDWISGRFKKKYPGYNVRVLKADGTKASGQTRLTTVRDTYLPAE